MAADTALEYMKTRVGGLGGVIVVSSSGEWAARFSTKQMSWATVKDDELHYGIYAGERHTKSVDEALASESEGFWEWRAIDYGRMKILIFLLEDSNNWFNLSWEICTLLIDSQTLLHLDPKWNLDIMITDIRIVLTDAFGQSDLLGERTV